MDTEKIIIGIIVLVTIGVFGFIAVSSFSNVKPTDAQLDVSTILGDARNFKGKAPNESDVILVEFSDFECPACASMAPIVKDVSTKYPELSIVYRHFPLSFHRYSRPAAIASEAAALQGKFWDYHDELFFSTPNLSQAELESYAQKVGLDIEKFKNDLKSQDLIDKVNKDLADGEKLRIRGTPTFYLINKGNVREIRIQDQNSLYTAISEILGSR